MRKTEHEIGIINKPESNKKMDDNLKKRAEEIIAVCAKMQEEQLIARTWGNVSARISENSFLITPSGMSYDDMTLDDLVLVTVNSAHKTKTDSKADSSIKKPSSEKGMHAEIYGQRPECRFIIHTHQTNASALSILGEDLVLKDYMQEEYTGILGSVIPCARYGLSSTKRLAKNVASAAKRNPDSKAVLMRYHGAVLMGHDAEEAMRAAIALEDVCENIYRIRCGEQAYTREDDTAEIESGGAEQNGRVILIHTPFVMEMCRRGKTLYPYLDDMAQIGGTKISCIDDMNEKDLRHSLKKNNAVLVRNTGAFCAADSPDEARAVATVLEKNCKAANLGLKKAVAPVPKLSAKLERTVYLKKYSRLKNK